MDLKIKEVTCSKFVCVTSTTQLHWIVTIKQMKTSSYFYCQFSLFLGREIKPNKQSAFRFVSSTATAYS
jgi:hypothetical protein